MKEIKNWNGISYTDDELRHLQNLFEEIRSYIEKPVTESNFKSVYLAAYNFFSGFPVSMIEITEKAILRSRENEKTRYFNHQNEVSYNSSKPEKIYLGRFNRPQEAVFYGSLPTEGEQANFLGTALIESCKSIIDDSSIESSFELTTGMWNVVPFMVVCFGFNDTHLEVNPRMKRNIEHFINDVVSKCDKRSSDFILSCLRYFSDLSAMKTDNESVYMILTAIFCAIRMKYQEEGIVINGIMYPSSVTDNKGLNIALMPHAVDKYLTLSNVIMYRFDRWQTDRKQFDAYPITQIINVVNEEFSFTNIGDKRPEIEAMYKQH